MKLRRERVRFEEYFCSIEINLRYEDKETITASLKSTFVVFLYPADLLREFAFLYGKILEKPVTRGAKLGAFCRRLQEAALLYYAKRIAYLLRRNLGYFRQFQYTQRALF